MKDADYRRLTLYYLYIDYILIISKWEGNER